MGSDDRRILRGSELPFPDDGPNDDSTSDASSGRSLDVWKKDGTSNTVTLTGGTFVTSGGPAGGSGSVVLSTQYTAKTLVCDPTSLWGFVK